MNNQLFLQNKYTRWYFLIITKRQTLTFMGYGESHHIIPKSMGGSDESSNRVRLTAREHFICHRLLTKMVKSEVHIYKMNTAFNAMMFMNSKWHERPHLSSRAFDKLKRSLVFTEEHRKKISDAAKRQWQNPISRAKGIQAANNRPPVSEATKAKMSASSKARNLTPELRQKFATAKDVWTGRSHSDEARQKISEARKGKPATPSQQVTCPHCQKSGAARAMTRWHFDNCSVLRDL